MKQEILKQKITSFEEEKLSELKHQLKELDIITQHFLRKFPIESIPLLKLEDYVIGKGDNDNFCYWLERNLDEIGNMLGGTSLKFGIYFGHTKVDKEDRFRFTRRFWGMDEHESYKKVNFAIVHILREGNNQNLVELANNPLSTMFKGKILATYFPDYYLHIYSDQHLDYFLKKLGIGEVGNAIYKRQALRQFKENQPEMAKWSLVEFCKFLYYAFEHPSKNEAVNLDLYEEELENLDLPKIEDVYPEFIEIHIENEKNSVEGQSTKRSKPAKHDYVGENERNKKLGTQGEAIALKAEKEWLIQNGKLQFVEEVEWVAENVDGHGFDILSRELDGSPKHIEVKSTTAKNGINFLITPNELEKAKKLSNYYIYIVYDAGSTRPKIFRWKSPFSLENPAINITPVQFRVTADASIVNQ